VAVFDGDERAFKVTTPLDFALARTLLEEEIASPSGRDRAKRG
jgi:2-C-methyl-D-erythritol 4-phosphate cytidylyltransferase